jgi:tripartite-type tricarboxylate transporter receptor subunit TctC
MKTARSRYALGFVFLAAQALAAPHAVAQAYPSKPIRMVLPSGGGIEVVARWVAARLSLSLGHQVYVDPRFGAGGNIAHESVATATPDGYTIMMVSTPFALNPMLYATTKYNVARDFAPISYVASLPNVLAVGSAVPVRTVAELVQLAKSKPGKLNYGSGAMGQTSHLAGELLKSQAKIDFVSVPYKGASFAMAAMVGGEVDFAMPSAPAAESLAKANRIRVLAVLDTKRLPSMPDVPTAAEAGLPQLQIGNWYVVVAPAGVPAAVVEKLNTELGKIMRSPEAEKYFASIGGQPVVSTPEQAAALLRTEAERWGKVIRDAGVKVAE